MHSHDDLLFRFKEHLAVLNRSGATIRHYSLHVRDFLDTMTSSDLKHVTQADIERYIADLYEYRDRNDRPYKIGTICVKVRGVKRFFEFLHKENLIFIDPTEEIREPAAPKSFADRTLSKTEITKLLDRPNLGTRKGIRDRTIMEVFYSTGIRIDELCRLSIFDADLTGKMLRVKGKGRKSRVVPMGKHACRFLREYIAKVRPHFTKKNRSTRTLFVTIHGQDLTTGMTAVMLRTYGREAGIEKNVSAHMFRHTFAVALLRGGAAPEAVQKMLGHACLRTTQMYTQAIGRDVKKVHARAHPREKDSIADECVSAVPQRNMFHYE